MKINERLLTKILGIQTSSVNEDAMLAYIKQYVTGIQLRYETDSCGNIYVSKVTKGINPIGLVAHTDTVHPIVDELTILKYDNILYGYGIDKGVYGPRGCGGDDKVGIYICLQALKDLPSIKCVFYRKEEIGCIGSNASNVNYLTDCKYIIQCDRRGNSDIITWTNGVSVCSKDFIADIKPIMTKYGYTAQTGSSTDVGVLVKKDIGISCINVSCGYHRPHTNETYVSLTDVETCYNLILDINTALTNQYPHKHVPIVTTYNASTYGYNSYYTQPKANKEKEKVVLLGYEVVERDGSYEYYDLSRMKWLHATGCKYCCNYNFTKLMMSDKEPLDKRSIEIELDKLNYGVRIALLHESCKAEGKSSYADLAHYVFSRLHDCWIDEQDAVWVEEIQTYIKRNAKFNVLATYDDTQWRARNTEYPVEQESEECDTMLY
jgi:hypothetical protein